MEARGWRVQQKGKRTHGHGQQGGECREEGDQRGTNGNGKNTMIKKTMIKKKELLD